MRFRAKQRFKRNERDGEEGEAMRKNPRETTERRENNHRRETRSRQKSKIVASAIGKLGHAELRATLAAAAGR